MDSVIGLLYIMYLVLYDNITVCNSDYDLCSSIFTKLLGLWFAYIIIIILVEGNGTRQEGKIVSKIEN